jgi:hypothetical protein
LFLVADAAGAGFYAAGVTEGGEALVWLCQPEGDVKLAVQQVARVNIGSTAAAAGSKEVIMCVFLEAAAAGRVGMCTCSWQEGMPW